jgi:hypothetical protein
MITRVATCDQIAPLPSVLSNEIAAPSAKTTATANRWARGRRLASHAATYPPSSANTAPYNATSHKRRRRGLMRWLPRDLKKSKRRQSEDQVTDNDRDNGSTDAHSSSVR